MTHFVVIKLDIVIREGSENKIKYFNISFLVFYLFEHDFDQILTRYLYPTLFLLWTKNKPFFLFFSSFEHYTDWFARYDQDCSRWSTCWHRTANRWYAHAIYYKRNMLNIGRHPCQHWFGNLRCPAVGQEGWLFWPAFIWLFFLIRKKQPSKTKWLMKKLNIVIWRENLCASQNANFHQRLVLEGTQLNFSSPKKFVKWKHVKPILLNRLIPMASVR